MMLLVLTSASCASRQPYSGWAFLGLQGLFGPPTLPKIRHTYPTMMKLGTVIPYLRKIQKMYKSRDTFLEFC